MSRKLEVTIKHNQFGHERIDMNRSMDVENIPVKYNHEVIGHVSGKLSANGEGVLTGNIDSSKFVELKLDTPLASSFSYRIDDWGEAVDMDLGVVNFTPYKNAND